MATNHKENLRRARRLQVTPRAEIIDGATVTKALIQDISDEGMLLLCSKNYTMGQTLVLKLQTSPGSIVECTVEVRHSSDNGTGIKIIAMSDQNRRTYERYLEEFFSLQLGKLG